MLILRHLRIYFSVTQYRASEEKPHTKHRISGCFASEATLNIEFT